MKCKRCGEEICEEEIRTYLGETLCDDCYLDARVAAKVCDLWAVYMPPKKEWAQVWSGQRG